MSPHQSYTRWAVVLLAALVPLAVIGAYSFHSARQSISRLTREHSRAVATIAGETLRQQLRRSIQLGRTVASFPVFSEATQRRDETMLRERLRRVVETNSEVDRAYVLDLDGVLWCDWPVAPESLGRSFAYRDYFMGISGRWEPYVSEVFQRQAQPRPLVIAVSTAIRNDSGEVVGILVLQHRLEAVTHWLRQVNLGDGGAVVVLDQNGVVAGHSQLELLQVRHDEYRPLEPVRQALEGHSATIEFVDPISSRVMMAAFQPIRLSASQNWVVVAERDMDEVFAPMRDLARQIALAVAIVAALALAAAVLLARSAERNRAMGIELQKRNVQLQDSIGAERQAHLDLKKAQSQLVQQEKLAGLGQMVAGIAHEINNPLSFVSNNTAVLQRDLLAIRDLLLTYRQGDEDLRRHRPDLLASINEQGRRMDLDYTLQNVDGLLARSREGLRRIQQIVKDLRDFARIDENMVIEADLNAGVASTVNIIHGRAKKKNVQLEFEPGNVAPVTCCISRINQVVMNLIANAIDACAEGGHVKVRTCEQSGNACVAVADDGTGIEPGILGRIFDPFFTTKPQGEGTGLGLSISYGIAQDHGGTIDVESTPGKGSTFTLRLPHRPAQDEPLRA